MIIEDYIHESKIVNAEFELSMTKANAAYESAYSDMNLFVQQAEIKVVTESGTIDDLAYYCEEATEGFVGKAKEVIIAIIEALKDFFSDLKTKIVKLFAGGDVTKTLDELEKKTRLNPFIKKKKCKIPDFNKQDACMKDYNRRLGKLIATAKSGSDVSLDDVENAEQEFNKSWIAAAAAITTITVVALIALTRKIQRSIETDVDSTQRETIGRMKNAADKVSDMVEPDKVAVLTRITQKTAANARKQASWLVNALVKCISTLKTTFNNKDAFISPGDTFSYDSADDSADEKELKDMEKESQATEGCDDCNEGCDGEDCDDPIASSVHSSFDEFDDFVASDDDARDRFAADNAIASDDDVDSFAGAMDAATDDDDSSDLYSDAYESVDDLMSDIDSLV